MQKCDCYEEYISSIEQINPTTKQYTYTGRCLGTRERDACLCRGNPAKCDFYPDKRDKFNLVLGQSISRSTLYDWYADRVDGELPSWIDALFNEFYLIPKEKTNG